MLIKVRGVTYPSVKAAAEALGVKTSAVYSALNRGNIETLGLGKSQPRPVDLDGDGLSFKSIRSASLALGFGRTYLSKVLTRESAHGLKRIEEAVKRYKQEMK